MATKDVPLQLLSVQLLGLSVITHEPLVTVRDVQTAVKPALCQRKPQMTYLQADPKQTLNRKYASANARVRHSCLQLHWVQKQAHYTRSAILGRAPILVVLVF